MMPIRDDVLLRRLAKRAAEVRVRHPCVDEEADRRAEEDLGFDLPQLLRAIYLSVANGGVGPGDGLVGLEGGALDESGLNLVELYQRFKGSVFDRREGRDPWPERVLPICSQGCGRLSCVDCRRRSAPVLFFDVDRYLTAYEPCQGSRFRRESGSLAEWLQEWLERGDHERLG